MKEAILGNRDGTVVMGTLTSHHCGLDSIPGPRSHEGRVCCQFLSLHGGFFSASSSFQSTLITNISNSNLTRKKWIRRATLWNVHC